MDYWKHVLSQRMSFEDEVTRLYTVARGFAYNYLMWAKEIDDIFEQNVALDLPYFINNTKRPYGNKDIPSSIIFNLGWDFERRLCKEYAPDWVQEEAMKLHRAVYELALKEQAIKEQK